MGKRKPPRRPSQDGRGHESEPSPPVVIALGQEIVLRIHGWGTRPPDSPGHVLMRPVELEEFLERAFDLAALHARVIDEARAAGLSPSEEKVCLLLACNPDADRKGLPAAWQAMFGGKLLSELTIKEYVRSACEKLGLPHSKTALARHFAVLAGVVN